MKLYSYYRSSASYRVRIALALKGLKIEIIPINLLTHQQQDDEYRAVNPQQLVPALEKNGQHFTQSLAIIEYLEETHPDPALLPSAPVERARVRALALAIACDISPLNNIGVQRYLSHALHAEEAQRTEWTRHWINKGFAAIEQLLAGNPMTGQYMHGDKPTLADCCLIPQVYNAQRFQCDLSLYPTIKRIAEQCDRHQAFMLAHPDNQADAVHA